MERIFFEKIDKLFFEPVNQANELIFDKSETTFQGFSIINFEGSYTSSTSLNLLNQNDEDSLRSNA